jgi:hypothetical protein
VRSDLVAATAILVSAVGVSTWLSAAEYPAIPPAGNFAERHTAELTLTGPDAASRRRDTLRRATFIVTPDVQRRRDSLASELLTHAVPTCRFVPSEPSGTTPKFDCVFAGGDTVKVKYNHDSEIYGEAAASALLRLLGYASDVVTLLPRLRCYGCPRHPFVAMHLRRLLHLPLDRTSIDNGFTDFGWVSVEHKFPAPEIETDVISGWEWRDLDEVNAPRAEVDAFRLLAAFLAHWDNKAQNQRLVCLDDTPAEGGCRHPLAMIQDLGATFGPRKVNLARWRDLPVWHDRTTCMLSMRTLPFEGATFEDVRITEAGRTLAAARLAAVSDAQIERLFADARFPQFQAGTSDERDLKAWTAAFRDRVRQIAEARCPN